MPISRNVSKASIEMMEKFKTNPKKDNEAIIKDSEAIMEMMEKLKTNLDVYTKYAVTTKNIKALEYINNIENLLKDRSFSTLDKFNNPIIDDASRYFHQQYISSRNKEIFINIVIALSFAALTVVSLGLAIALAILMAPPPSDKISHHDALKNLDQSLQEIVNFQTSEQDESYAKELENQIKDREKLAQQPDPEQSATGFAPT